MKALEIDKMLLDMERLWPLEEETLLGEIYMYTTLSQVTPQFACNRPRELLKREQQVCRHFESEVSA